MFIEILVPETSGTSSRLREENWFGCVDCFGGPSSCGRVIHILHHRKQTLKLVLYLNVKMQCSMLAAQ